MPCIAIPFAQRQQIGIRLPAAPPRPAKGNVVLRPREEAARSAISRTLSSAATGPDDAARPARRRHRSEAHAPGIHASGRPDGGKDGRSRRRRHHGSGHRRSDPFSADPRPADATCLAHGKASGNFLKGHVGQAADCGDDGPDFVVPALCDPARHAGVFDAVLDGSRTAVRPSRPGWQPEARGETGSISPLTGLPSKARSTAAGRTAALTMPKGPRRIIAMSSSGGGSGNRHRLSHDGIAHC